MAIVSRQNNLNPSFNACNVNDLAQLQKEPLYHFQFNNALISADISVPVRVFWSAPVLICWYKLNTSSVFIRGLDKFSITIISTPLLRQCNDSCSVLHHWLTSVAFHTSVREVLRFTEFFTEWRVWGRRTDGNEHHTEFIQSDSITLLTRGSG